MKRLITLGITMVVFMLAFGGMAYGAYYPWGQGMVNVNTATEDELVWFLGNGNISNPQELAESIIEYREASGPFTSVDELMSIQGIDRDNYDDVRLWLKTEGVTDYDPEKTVRPHRDPFFGYGTWENRRD
jgi:hypothetical protein